MQKNIKFIPLKSYIFQIIILVCFPVISNILLLILYNFDEIMILSLIMWLLIIIMIIYFIRYPFFVVINLEESLLINKMNHPDKSRNTNSDWLFNLPIEEISDLRVVYLDKNSDFIKDFIIRKFLMLKLKTGKIKYLHIAFFTKKQTAKLINIINKKMEEKNEYN